MITGIIVVSYHNSEGTQKYVLEQLFGLTDSYRVVVVAVDANEQYGRILATNCRLGYVNEVKNVKPHPTGWCVSVNENLGYAKGNNLGVEILKNSGLHFDNYLFSNDDIEIINPNMLSVLASSMQKDEQCAGIGPRVIGLDGGDQSPHSKYISPKRQIGWKLFPFLRSKSKSVSRQETDSNKTVAEVAKSQRLKITAEQAVAQASYVPPAAGTYYWVSGSFMMVSADRFNFVGGFDSRTFLYYEEAILAERFMFHNWRFSFEPSVSVVHYEGGSTTIKSAKRDTIEMESRMLYYKEYKHEYSWLLWLYKKISKI